MYAAIIVGILVWAGLYFLTGSICWFQATFGVPCPGCGSTRAAVLLLGGNITEALAWHPLIFVSIVLLPYIVIRGIFWRGKPYHKYEKYAMIGIVAIYITVFIVRMILYFPHTAPMDMNGNSLLQQALRIFLK